MTLHHADTGPSVIHAIEGRARFRLPVLAEDASAASLEIRLKALPGLHEARVNAPCRSVTITYEPTAWTTETLLARLAAIPYEPVAAEPADGEASAAGLSTDDTPGSELWWSSAGLGLMVLAESVVAPALLLVGALPMLRRAFKTLADERRLNTDVLDTAAVTVLTVQGAMHGAGLIIWLVNLADHLCQANIHRWKESVRAVLPAPILQASTVRSGRVVMVPAARVLAGEVLLYRTGEMVLADGIVLWGNATVDESALTGDPAPVKKLEGMAVHAGSVVQEGEIHLSVERIGPNTRIAHVVARLESATLSDTELQASAIRWSDTWVSAGFLGAGVGAIVAGLTGAATVLIVAKYLLQIVDDASRTNHTAPAAAMRAIAKGARRGMLVTSGRTLERLATIDAVLLELGAFPNSSTNDRMQLQSMIQALKTRGVREIILSAEEHPVELRRMAEALAVTCLTAGREQSIPAEVLGNLQRAGRTVAVIVDGHNGSAILRQADVGMVVIHHDQNQQLDGHGAHVILVSGGFWKVPAAIDLGREAVGWMHQRWRLMPVPNAMAWPLAATSLVWAPAMSLLALGYYGSHAMATANGLALLTEAPPEAPPMPTSQGPH